MTILPTPQMLFLLWVGSVFMFLISCWFCFDAFFRKQYFGCAIPILIFFNHFDSHVLISSWVVIVVYAFIFGLVCVSTWNFIKIPNVLCVQYWYQRTNKTKHLPNSLLSIFYAPKILNDNQVYPERIYQQCFNWKPIRCWWVFIFR